MAEKIHVNEVGLRDGLQIHAHFVPTDDKLALIDALIDAGVTSFEATSFVSPKAVPQMADAAELFARLPQRDRIAYHALVPNERGYERAVDAGVKSVAVVLAASDTLNRKNINMTLDEAVAVCTAVLGRARGGDCHPRLRVGCWRMPLRRAGLAGRGHRVNRPNVRCGRRGGRNCGFDRRR